ncbi:MAG TPA: hypothetical protein VGL68_01590 [Solirubrobacteraceae bacterium]|jgi:hypothetical protein
MAYVVARRNGRFEIRESLHTPKGPRARSLVGFETLTDKVLETAAGRATRSFDADTVMASARRAGAPLTASTDVARGIQGSPQRFVEASRRMARSMRRASSSKQQTDPGTSLIELLGFVDAVARSQPARPFEPLTFPVLARLVEGRSAAAGA